MWQHKKNQTVKWMKSTTQNVTKLKTKQNSTTVGSLNQYYFYVEIFFLKVNWFSNFFLK